MVFCFRIMTLQSPSCAVSSRFTDPSNEYVEPVILSFAASYLESNLNLESFCTLSAKQHTFKAITFLGLSECTHYTCRIPEWTVSK